MKLMGLNRVVLPSLLLAATTSVFASDNSGNDEAMNNISTYLLNLGQYLGYNVQMSPTNPNNPTGVTTVSETLLNISSMQSMQTYLINTLLGAFPINTSSGTVGSFVPNTTTGGYSNLNGLANYTFSTINTAAAAYNTLSNEKISVSNIIDQPTYQTDPVSQSILNIVGTPDYSYCLNNDGTAEVTCNYDPPQIVNNFKVMSSVLGDLPSTQTYFTYDYNKPIIGQLNANSLLGPLLYSYDNPNGSTTSSPTLANNGIDPGLTANNQAQQAANFIRYAGGLVSPAPLPKRNDYDALYIKAKNQGSPAPYTFMESQQAKSILTAHLMTIRMYAAYTSVGISNLYYILSKRMPQNQQNSNNNQVTSQALSEYTMATWRLFNPDPNTQWLTAINKASDATVKKEMASLLAEINYQLYLQRVIQERILLTNSIIVLQNARTSFLPPQTLSDSSPDNTTPTSTQQ